MLEIEEISHIIEDFSRQFTAGEIDRDFFSDFIIYNDMGVPLAQSVVYNLATLTEQGRAAVLETWQELCVLLEIDPLKEYEDFDDCLDEAEGLNDEE